jgi:hypothetical protein
MKSEVGDANLLTHTHFRIPGTLLLVNERSKSVQTSLPKTNPNIRGVKKPTIHDPLLDNSNALFVNVQAERCEAKNPAPSGTQGVLSHTVAPKQTHSPAAPFAGVPAHASIQSQLTRRVRIVGSSGDENRGRSPSTVGAERTNGHRPKRTHLTWDWCRTDWGGAKSPGVSW